MHTMDSTQLERQEQKAVAGEPGRRGISGSTIKIIAVAAMLIDHAAAAVLARYLVGGINEAMAAGSTRTWLEENAALYSVYNIMRAIGRLGFPIFCFLLVEGFQRTRSVKKYFLRLGIFALVSELPFNLAICGQWSNLGYQNVYFTLALGLAALCAFGFFVRCEGRPEKDLPVAVRIVFMVTGALSPLAYIIMCIQPPEDARDMILVCVLALAATLTILLFYGVKRGLRRLQTACASLTALALCMMAAELLRTDYAGMGVLTIAVMYLCRKRKALAMLSGCVVLTVMSLSELPAFFAILPIALYNGKRGLRMKYFFYAFYPVHLLLLYVVAVLLGLGGVSLL